MPLMTQGFKSPDKLDAIRLAERSSQNRNSLKTIAVQHFNDTGQADSPAEIVLTQVGHSPVAINALNGGYFVAIECDPQALTQSSQDRQQRQDWQQPTQPQYSNQ